LVLDLDLDLDVDPKKPDGMMLDFKLPRLIWEEIAKAQVEDQGHVQVEVQVHVA
jgi:hypothetical protein